MGMRHHKLELRMRIGWSSLKNKLFKCYLNIRIGVDRLSAPILSILPIIDIGHFQNRFADNFFLIYFFIYYYYANKHTIYR